MSAQCPLASSASVWRTVSGCLILACALVALPAAAGLDSWPRCIDVTFTGNGVTGLPPLTYRWEVSNGLTFSGNPGVLNTALLPVGSYSARLRVTNAFGQALSLPYFFSIERLAFTGTPVWTNLGGRVVEFQAQTTGATEYRWEWGDGTFSPWIVGCDGQVERHTYLTTGTYAARLHIRNCVDGTLVSAPFTVTVTQEQQLAVLTFEAFCPFGFCVFDVGEEIFFTTLVQGAPSTYAYDWNGDGLTDQVTSQPVLSHTYFQPGAYVPRLTISRGTQAASLGHHLPITVLGASNLIFADGFETGTTSAWSITVGRRP